MIDVLSGHVRVSSVAHRVKWLGPAADVMPDLDDEPSPLDAIDYTLMTLVHGDRPALRELDTVRRWLGEIGTPETLARELTASPDRWVTVVKALLQLAKDKEAATLSGSIALWRLVAEAAVSAARTR